MILKEKLRDELKAVEKQMDGEGLLHSPSQLRKYYDTFRERFHTDVLQNLDGEELLNTLHRFGDKDSLVYWLEFKDDDKLPAIFGKISGGSALTSAPGEGATRWLKRSPKEVAVSTGGRENNKKLGS